MYAGAGFDVDDDGGLGVEFACRRAEFGRDGLRERGHPAVQRGVAGAGLSDDGPAVTPYVTWMKTTATQAEQAASQLNAAAAAFEHAFASVVPPPLIAPEPRQLAQAMATNVLGQNTGVIAQLEAQYGQMWAQDSSTLYNYAAQSSTATKVTPFTSAPTGVHPGRPGQAGVPRSIRRRAPGRATPRTRRRTRSLSTPQTLAADGKPRRPPPTTTPPSSELWFLLTGQTILPQQPRRGSSMAIAPFASFAYNTEGLPYFSVGMGNFGVQIAKTSGMLGGAAASAAAAAPKGLAGLGGMLGGGAAHPAVAAGLGNAARSASLSVPAAVERGATGGHAICGGTGQRRQRRSRSRRSGQPAWRRCHWPAWAVPGVGAGAGPRYGFKPTVMARPPFAG